MSQPLREQLKVAAEKAVLVGVQLPGSYIDPADPFSELRALAKTAGAKVVGEMIQKKSKPTPRTCLGKGKVEELAEIIKMVGATLVIFDNDLSPSQIRNLEKDLSPALKDETSGVNPVQGIKIIDRSELILDIFANRAATHAAKLQVEIAQLEYTYPRLRAMWDHLGQIVGGAPVGIGTRGPGEQQIEIDRRIVQRRLAQLKRELEQVQQRKSREVANRRIDHFTAGLVGYTNAGKSTLFNAITESGGAYAHDKLFATLSTRIEKWKLPRGNEALLSDTVGFIRNLPHHLVASFRSTLEETIYAHLIIIVVDVADPNARMQLATVEETLDDIGATDQKRLLVLNKIDKLNGTDPTMAAGAPRPCEETVEDWLADYPDAIALSAVTGDGLDTLSERALDIMLGGVREVKVTTSLSDTRTISFLEQKAEVLDRVYDNGTVTLTTRLGRRHVDQLLAAGSPLRINGSPALDEAKRLWDYLEPQKDALPDPPPHEKFWT